MMFHGLFPMTFLMVVVLGAIFAGFATATESAGVGVLGSLMLAWFNGRLNLTMLRSAIREGARANALVFLLFLGATGFSYVFRAIGGDDLMFDVLRYLGITTKWEILAFVMALIFFLGFPFEWIEICLIVLPIFIPVLAKLDFGDFLGDKAWFMPWFATLVAVNLQTSFMTPPFGATLFYMKGTVPPNITMSDVYRGMTPFVILQLIGLGICVAFPELSLWLPRLAGFLD
jgi:TRAP-type mannitol/chloroaromatic compound transport system permease large subunit